MKLFSIFALLAGLAGAPFAFAANAPEPLRIVPTTQQLAWQRAELAMFFHFGMNTFTDHEAGDGTESEAVFNPVSLDCRQWARTAKQAGFKLLILTAKHRDGFCLWPSKFTEHSVKNSPWKAGKGDVVREFVEACRAENVKVGLYLSPSDKNSALYGSDAYNDYFVNQLTELLTNYGPIDEFWWNTEIGKDRNGKWPNLDWNRFNQTVQKLAPNAVINSGVRWVGDFSGVAPPGQSNVEICSYGGGFGGGSGGGIPQGGFGGGSAPCRWRPVHCDTSLRPGWFYHASEDAKVKSLAKLMEIYCSSVGRNSVLMLNVPPDRRGLLADADVQRLKEFGAALRSLQDEKIRPAAVRGSLPFGDDYTPNKANDGELDTFFASQSTNLTPWLELDFGTPRTFNVLNVREAIALGERARAYRVDAELNGQWRTIARGTIIGQRNLIPLEKTRARRVQLVIEDAEAAPCIAEFSAHWAPTVPPPVKLPLTAFTPAVASDTKNNDIFFGASRAVDGDEDTYWAANDATRECHLGVAWEKPQTFNRVTIQERESRITHFAIEYQSGEGGAWQAAYIGDKAGKNFSVNFPPVSAQAVRLHIFDAAAAPEICEFGVWSP